MNPLIDYYDNVVMKTNWSRTCQANTDAIFNKCSELAKASSVSEQAEFLEHVNKCLEAKENEST